MKIKVADRISEVQEYYFSRKLREIAERRSEGEDIINLGIGSPDLAPAPEVIEELTRAAADPANHGYQSYRGIVELRTAFSDFYQRHFQVGLDPETEVLPLIGSKEGIMHISMAYLDHGDEVLVPNPGYPSYRAAARLAGATVMEYKLKSNWLPDFKELAKRNLSKVKIMWVNYPHMPTGQDAPPGFFEQLVDFATEYRILLCHDNPYAFILNDRPTSLLSVPGSKKVAVELMSLSKAFNMAGWRVGAMVGNEDRISEVLRFKSNMDSGMFKPVQLAAVAALRSPKTWFDSLNVEYKARRVLAEEILKQLGCQMDGRQVGMFVWAKVGSLFPDGETLSDHVLDQAGVFITPGMIFGSGGKKYVRISLCSPQPILAESLRRIKHFMVSTIAQT